MTAAIWSTPAAHVGHFPAAALIRFCENHGLLRITNRPRWRTVQGGSRTYVERLSTDFLAHVRLGAAVSSIRRDRGTIIIRDQNGNIGNFDHVVIAAHADDALHMLVDATVAERRTLGSFQYIRNKAILHSDPALMPRRKTAWSSWNYLAGSTDAASDQLSVTYWMNKLQGLSQEVPFFVSLNPFQQPRSQFILSHFEYEHPFLNDAAIEAQTRLWSLQGRQNTWFCGAYFGSGFHEDGLQAGLAVAEALGGVRRPWNVANESGRIFVKESAAPSPIAELAT
jgi:uncharacterized protein